MKVKESKQSEISIEGDKEKESKKSEIGTEGDEGKLRHVR
jgi:hypothetical protein